MFKKQKKIFSFTLIVSILMLGISLDFSVFASEISEYDNRNIIYITDESNTVREYFEILDGKPIKSKHPRYNGIPLKEDYIDRLKGKSINNNVEEFILNDVEAKNYVAKDRDISKIAVKKVSSKNINKLNNRKHGIFQRIFNTKVQDNIWIDDELLENEEIVDNIKELINDNYKIVIKRDNFSAEEILEIFDLNLDLLKSKITNDKGNIQLNNVGVLIQKNTDDRLDIKLVNVEINSDEEIDHALLFATRSNFTERIRQDKKEKNFIKQNSVKAISFNWSAVDTLSTIDSYNYGNVEFSMLLEKNAANPDSNGNHYFTMKTFMDVVPNSFRRVVRTEITQRSWSSVTSIIDYGPKNTTGSSFSISLPWGVTVNFETGRTKTRVESGGIGSSSVCISYMPSGVNLGSDRQSYAQAVLASQESSSYYGNNLGQMMSYEVWFIGITVFQNEKVTSNLYACVGT
ncbi:UNVERIFIED_CONTAM: hypothetical protein Cloal_0925 [Acetivibrio alkalicellulosi]